MRRWLILTLAVLVLALLGWGLWRILVPIECCLPPPSPEVPRVDHILIEKSARRLVASLEGQPVLEFDIALGFAPEGDKMQEGDGKTPEGLFQVDRRNAQSSYHLSLGLDYPLAEDEARAAEAGVDPGGDIFIHGQPNAVGNVLTLPGDWTAGCIAISNQEMEQLWALVEIGTTVEIRP